MITLKLLSENNVSTWFYFFFNGNIQRQRIRLNMFPFATRAFATRCVIRIRENPDFVDYSLYHVSKDGKRHLQQT